MRKEPTQRDFIPAPLASLIAAILGVLPLQATSSATLLVTDCSDGAGSGTLRHTIDVAPDSSTVQIPLMCSKITLAQGYLHVPNTITNLYITGQGPAATTIDGADSDRVFMAENAGVLDLDNMTVAHGKNTNSAYPLGGCVYAGGSIGMVNTVVTGCKIAPVNGYSYAEGGGVFTRKFATLLGSTVTGNVATAVAGSTSRGGGVYAGQGFTAVESTISDNAAQRGTGGAFSRGGGIFVKDVGIVLITYSTISENTADVNSGLEVVAPGSGSPSASISSSTISGNKAGVYQAVASYVPISIVDSTIAFNRAASSGQLSPVGLYSTATITMKDSIFAANTSKSGVLSDVFSTAPSNPLVGANDLITATANSVPLGTLNACPRLGHLSDNGGPTKTIPLLANSPALDVGSANGATTDQRGTGFTRTAGTGTDIGAYERQAGVHDDIVFYGEFESPCD